MKSMKTPPPEREEQQPTPGPAPGAGGETDLAAVERDFVELWRNMAALWGINPTMAEIHGLLFITGQALSMDDLMARLEISRGNVSMNLSRLVEWGLVHRVHRRGDRRDYYESPGDVWELFTLVAAQRKRREIDPMLYTLRQCRDRLTPADRNATAGDSPERSERRRRITDLLAFLTLVDELAQRFFANHRNLRAALELLARKE
jgi:DNA-binding transcriptional regulator GbsR (MarR family)